MQLTSLKGYPDFVGLRADWVGYGVGPTSYSQTTGDVIVLPRTNWYIDAVPGGVMSVSGTYFVRGWPSSGVGARQTWALRWFVTSTGLEVAATTNLSAEKIQIALKVGQY